MTDKTPPQPLSEDELHVVAVSLINTIDQIARKVLEHSEAGEQCDDCADDLLIFISAWNAIEENLAYLQNRDPRSILGISDLSDGEIIQDLFGGGYSPN